VRARLVARACLHIEFLQTGLAVGKRGFVEHDETFLTAVNSFLAESDPLLARLP